jgi:hypothetical protein
MIRAWQIEDSEDDAHAICAEQGLEFVCLCDDG